MSLREGLSDLSVKLLNEIRGDVELDVLLNGCEEENPDAEVEYLKRIKMALEHQVKKVMRNAFCLQSCSKVSYEMGSYEKF